MQVLPAKSIDSNCISLTSIDSFQVYKNAVHKWATLATLEHLGANMIPVLTVMETQDPYHQGVAHRHTDDWTTLETRECVSARDKLVLALTEMHRLHPSRLSKLFDDQQQHSSARQLKAYTRSSNFAGFFTLSRTIMTMILFHTDVISSSKLRNFPLSLAFTLIFRHIQAHYTYTVFSSKHCASAKNFPSGKRFGLLTERTG